MRIFKIMAVIMITSVLMGCKEEVGSVPANIDSSISDDGNQNNPINPPGVPGDDVCQSIDHQQPMGNGDIDALDILFVVDTSGSLSEEKAQVVAGIDQFINNLDPQIDYQIGVLLAHSPSSQWGGVIYKKNSEPRILTKAMGATAVKNHLSTKFSGFPPDDSEGEMGIHSLNQSVTTKLAQNQGYGFFRSNAALAVVFVADENDICFADYPAGYTPVEDTEKVEPVAFSKYCGGINHSVVYSNIKLAKGNKAVIISGILHTTFNYPAGSNPEDEYGWGYLEMIALNEGVAIDLNSNIGEGLREIAEVSTDAIVIKKVFNMPATTVKSSIQSLVDGSLVSHTYNEITHEVSLDFAGLPGSNVKINYCMDAP